MVGRLGISSSFSLSPSSPSWVRIGFLFSKLRDHQDATSLEFVALLVDRDGGKRDVEKAKGRQVVAGSGEGEEQTAERKKRIDVFICCRAADF